MSDQVGQGSLPQTQNQDPFAEWRVVPKDDHGRIDFDAWEAYWSPANAAMRRADDCRLLQSVVSTATPLIAAIDGDELAAAIEKLPNHLHWQPTFSESGWQTFWRSPAARVEELPKRPPPIGRRTDAESRFESLFRKNGVVLRGIGDPRGGSGLKVVGRTLEMAFASRDAAIVTKGGKVRVELRVELPASIVVAASGLMLDEIVGHDLFDGRGFRIRRATVANGTTLLTADTGLVPYTMPWPDLI